MLIVVAFWVTSNMFIKSSCYNYNFLLPKRFNIDKDSIEIIFWGII